LIQTTDEASTIPLEGNSVDFINCQGVLQHASHPERVLREFYRVMKPHARAVVMVYNRDSLWLHLYTAYQCLVLQDAFPGMNAYEAFNRNVDGIACPIARAYAERDFRSLCQEVGFTVDYVGGYLAETEMASLERYHASALQDARLQDEHKQFLRNLTYDRSGYPLYKGKHAGIGGVYRLYCWEKESGSQRDLARSWALEADLADLREQIVQTGSRYTQFRSRCAAMERDDAAIQNWKRRWLSLPGIPAARSMCRGLLRLSRFFG
jgi:SAM-dependent methyltransferase